MTIQVSEQGVSITEKRVAYNKAHPSYCAYCGARMVWDRVTEYRRGEVIPQKLVKLCSACLGAGRKAPEPEEYQILDCGKGHDLNVTASRNDGACKTCRKQEKNRKYKQRLRDEARAMKAGAA